MRIGYLLEAGVPEIRQIPPSGPANHVVQVVTHLGRLGHDVRILAQLDGRIWASDDLVSYRPVPAAPMDRGWRRLPERALRRVQWQMGLPYFSFFDSRRFAAACVRELRGVDVLYERMGWMGLGGSLAAGRLRLPHVLEVNGELVAELDMLGFAPTGLQRAVSLRLMGRMIRRASHAVTTGDGWRSRHLDRWKVAPEKVSVVHNGTEMVDLLRRDSLRCFSGREATDGRLNLVFAGSFEPWHALPDLLTAAATAVGAGADLTLTLAGSGREEARVKEMASALGLSARVVFTGQLPVRDLAACFSRCDVGVCLYKGRVEYAGLKLLDYKAAGLATIASGEGGQPTLVEHERTGLIIPPGDVHALSRAMLALAANVDLRREMGRRARDQAERLHGWDQTARALDRLLVGLVQEHATHTGALRKPVSA